MVENTSNPPFFMTPLPQLESTTRDPQGPENLEEELGQVNLAKRSHLRPQEGHQQVLLVLVVVLNKHYPLWPHGGAVSKGKRI